MRELRELRGGQLVSINFDPVGHKCELCIDVLDMGQLQTFRVSCVRVSDLHFRNIIPEPWTYAEVTEAYESVSPSNGQQVLELMLWSEESDMTITAERIRLVEDDRG